MALIDLANPSRFRALVELSSDYDRPETIEETAQLVTELGGVGIAIPTDHLDIAQVGALADRLRRDYPRSDAARKVPARREKKESR